MKKSALLPSFLLVCAVAFAQQPAMAPSDEMKPRIFVTDSQSWEMRGAAGGSSAGFGAVMAGGARPQTAEVIKTFGERCPGTLVTNKQDRADYVAVFEHEGGKGYARKRNKVALFNRNGDSIFSNSTRSLGNSVQDSCDAIQKDWKEHGAIHPREAAANPTNEPAARTKSAKVAISSNPPGADIEVDGSFLGSTPSSIQMSSGEHILAIKKPGYSSWEKKIKISEGEISIAAELEKQ